MKKSFGAIKDDRPLSKYVYAEKTHVLRYPGHLDDAKLLLDLVHHIQDEFIHDLCGLFPSIRDTTY